MNFETTTRVSRALAVAGVPHTVQVGRHDKLAPEGETEFPGIHCRIDLGIPRAYDGGVSRKIAEVEAIVEPLGLVLATGMMGDGLTISTPRETPGELLRRPGDQLL